MASSSSNYVTSNMNLPTGSSVSYDDLVLFVQELRGLGFDAIRFASYRTAAKLRYIQKKCSVDLLDIWNIIEAFRDNGLNTLDRFSIITVPKLEAIILSLYVNLNKRLPQGQLVDVSSSARYLLSWLLIAYDNEGSGRIRVFSVKVGLVTLCNGKLVDKLRYIFSQISDPNGTLIFTRFKEYLQEVLALPSMVLESPTFGYKEDLAEAIFNGTSKLFLGDFLDTLLSDPGPLCLIWMPLVHAIAGVEDVNHSVSCNVCRSPTIQGFRYKCQKCSNFNMCQNCFWQGKISENHRTEHEVKEYSTSKPGGVSLRNSFRKSFRCVPKSKKMPRFPDQPDRPLNLAHIVPPSPLPTHNGFTISTPAAFNQMDAYVEQMRVFPDMGYSYGPSNSNNRSTSSYSESLSESDEEHRLIARYTARLASESKYSTRTISQTSMSIFNSTQTQREMIAQLEARNRDIMREIARLRYHQELEYLNDESVEPIVMDELEALRCHKSDLEEKLAGLQDSRHHLMGQMEGLMKLLKAQQSLPSVTMVKPPAYVVGSYSLVHRSAPTTPQHQPIPFDGELRSAFSTGEEEFNSISSDNSSLTRYLRNDLLLAADSVTNAMSSLVRELNSDEDELTGCGGNGLQSGHELYRTTVWNKEVEKMRLAEEEKYLEELRNMRLSNGSDLDQSQGHHERGENDVEDLYFSTHGGIVVMSPGDNNTNESDGGDGAERHFSIEGEQKSDSMRKIGDDEEHVKEEDGNRFEWDDELKNWADH